MNKIWLGWLLFASWVISMSWLLYQTGNQHYGEFDPERQLQQQTQQLSLLNAVAGAQSSNAVLLHVLDPACPCTDNAKTHIKTLQAELQSRQLQQLYLTSAEAQAMGITVPATPMVIYLQNRQLIYSGPYASGPACSAKNSMLSAVLQNTSRLPGSWFNSETWACRCPNNSNHS